MALRARDSPGVGTSPFECKEREEEEEEEEETEEEEEDDEEEEEEGTDPIGFRGLNAARLCSNLNKMCLGWSPCLAPPSFTNPITCPLCASSITCQLYYVPITCQAHVIELARNRVRPITCPLRATLLRNLCETYYVHVIGLLRAYSVPITWRT